MQHRPLLQLLPHRVGTIKHTQLTLGINILGKKKKTNENMPTQAEEELHDNGSSSCSLSGSSGGSPSETGSDAEAGTGRGPKAVQSRQRQ